MTDLNHRLQHVDDAKEAWEVLKRADSEGLFHDKLRMLWTYHSNALEGNTFSLGDTIFFLREGLTVQGKPLKDHLEARNHAEAIDALYDVVRNVRPLTEGLIKDLNALLLKGIDTIPAMTADGQRITKKITPGAYKKMPNHVLTLSGAIHHYVEPLEVPAHMQALLDTYQKEESTRHPVLVAADLHYGIVRIHPFDDCNGRVARLVMNLVLLKAGYPPAVIPIEWRREYLSALMAADEGNRTPFYDIVAKSVGNALEIMRAPLT